jgi:tetratricopeptide (TPR) repeat protein
MEQIKKYTSDDITPAELDLISRSLLRAHKQSQRKAKWEQRLAAEHATVRTARRSPRLHALRWPIGIAASIGLLLAVYFLMPPFASTPTPNQLASTFLTEVAPPASGNIRKGEGRQSGSEFFDLGEYAKAIAALEAGLQQGKAEENAPLLLGISYLYTQQPDRAIEVLTNFGTNNKTTARKYNDILRWYLGIAFIQTNRYEEAKRQLAQLQPGDWQYQKAQDWIQKLAK